MTSGSDTDDNIKRTFSVQCKNLFIYISIYIVTKKPLRGMFPAIPHHHHHKILLLNAYPCKILLQIDLIASHPYGNHITKKLIILLYV